VWMAANSRACSFTSQARDLCSRFLFECPCTASAASRVLPGRSTYQFRGPGPAFKAHQPDGYLFPSEKHCL
jgi:hypothetical protein